MNEQLMGRHVSGREAWRLYFWFVPYLPNALWLFLVVWACS